MNKQTRQYIIEKAARELMEYICICLAALAFLGVMMAPLLLQRWLLRTYPLFGLIFSGELIWFFAAMIIDAAKKWIAKATDEARGRGE